MWSFLQGINESRHCVKAWMMPHILSLSLLALLLKGLYASPAILQERSVTQLSPADLGDLAPFTQFARAAYCRTSILKGWNCGGDCLVYFKIWISTLINYYFGLIEACAANHRFQPTVVGGDGNDVQICEQQASSASLSFDSQIFSLCWFLARSGQYRRCSPGNRPYSTVIKTLSQVSTFILTKDQVIWSYGCGYINGKSGYKTIPRCIIQRPSPWRVPWRTRENCAHDFDRSNAADVSKREQICSHCAYLKCSLFFLSFFLDCI